MSVPFCELGLDKGIAGAVFLLMKFGIETIESCEGGKKHPFPEPTVRFDGDRSEGFRALAVALQHALPVSYLKRVWSINDGEPTGPEWELVFWKKVPMTEDWAKWKHWPEWAGG